MRALVIGLILSVLTIASSAQVIRFKAVEVSYRELNERTNVWGEFSKWEPSNILIVMNLDESTIDIYAKAPYQLYAYSSFEKVIEDGLELLRFKCVDDSGLKCESVFVKQAVTGNQFLVVEYSNFEFMYHITDF